MAFKQLRLIVDHFDSQALALSSTHMYGFQFATLYSLQHGLPGYAQLLGCFDHRKIADRRIFHKACLEFFCHADLPRGSWRDLLAGQKTIFEPAQQRGGRQLQNLSRPSNTEEFSLRRLVRSLETGNVSIPSQRANMPSSESFTGCGLAALAIENAGYHVVGVVNGQPSQQLDCVFICAHAVVISSR